MDGVQDGGKWQEYGLNKKDKPETIIEIIKMRGEQGPSQKKKKASDTQAKRGGTHTQRKKEKMGGAKEKGKHKPQKPKQYESEERRTKPPSG